jgi:hypothetical protein
MPSGKQTYLDPPLPLGTPGGVLYQPLAEVAFAPYEPPAPYELPASSYQFPMVLMNKMLNIPSIMSIYSGPRTVYGKTGRW